MVEITAKFHDQKEVIMKIQTARKPHEVSQSHHVLNTTTASSRGRAYVAARAVFPAMLMLVAFAGQFPSRAAAQQAGAAVSRGSGGGTQATIHVLIPAPLGSSLDSKKLKSGDEVVVKTTANLALSNGTIIPRGTKVIGHVTEAKARSKGDSESSLTIAFDKLALPEGKTMDISGVIRALAPDLRDASPGGGGVGYTDLQQATYSPSVSAAPRSVPRLNEDSVGVVGIKDLQLSSDGVLTSSSKSVKLDSGDQVVVQVQMASGM